MKKLFFMVVILGCLLKALPLEDTLASGLSITGGKVAISNKTDFGGQVSAPVIESVTGQCQGFLCGVTYP